MTGRDMPGAFQTVLQTSLQAHMKTRHRVATNAAGDRPGNCRAKRRSFPGPSSTGLLGLPSLLLGF